MSYLTYMRDTDNRIVNAGDPVDVFVAFYAEAQHPPKEQRSGQWAFNLLCYVRADLADRVNGSLNLDPFHNDEKLPAFWKFVEDNWL